MQLGRFLGLLDNLFTRGNQNFVRQNDKQPRSCQNKRYLSLLLSVFFMAATNVVVATANNGCQDIFQK